MDFYRLVARLPPGLRSFIGWKDREADAEKAIAAALADWPDADRGFRVEIQGAVMGAMSQLSAKRLLDLAVSTPHAWLRLKAVELLERRRPALGDVVKLWEALRHDRSIVPHLGRLAAQRFEECAVPAGLPDELLSAAVDAGGPGGERALDASLERQPPALEGLFWRLRAGNRSPKLLETIRRQLRERDFHELAELANGLSGSSPIAGAMSAALAEAAKRLPAQELSDAAEDHPEQADLLVAEIVRRLGHLSSPIGRRHSGEGGKPKPRDLQRLRKLGTQLMTHARPEEAERLLEQILDLELRRTRAGLGPICAQDVAAMLCRYPTGVVGAQAAETLGLIGTSASIVALSEAAASLDENIRQRALKAISAIKARATRGAPL